MTLRIKVKGFGSPEGLNPPKPNQYGEVTFTFETVCEGDCTFKFKEVWNTLTCYKSVLKFNLQGRVVQKPINANPRFKS